MTARDYADRVRDLLADFGPLDSMERVVQQLLVLREHDVADIAAYVNATALSIEALQAQLTVYADYHQQVTEWVTHGMTRGSFPRRPS